MNTPPLHILLIEDNLGDARLVREHLVDAPGKPPFTLDHAPSLGTAFDRLTDGAQPDEPATASDADPVREPPCHATTVLGPTT